MKSPGTKIFCVILFLLYFPGCKKQHTLSEAQKILFHYDYVNYTRGFRHWGFFVSVDGNILTYYNPPAWNFSDINHILAEQEVNENISYCTITGRTVPKTELQKYINYIDNIAASKVTLLKSSGNEMGTATYYCFQYSENTSTYKTAIIKMEGDSECENLNFYSKKVIEWMRNICNDVSK